MSGLNRLAGAFGFAALLAACDSITGNDDSFDSSKDAASAGKAITTSAEARQAFVLLRASGDFVDRGVSTPFNGATSISGAAGHAAVSGRKTASSTSSSSSSSNTRMTDLQINFADFKASASAMAVNGNVRWFDYSYSRTACSSSTCASSSERSESMKATAIRVQFEYAGERYSDTINLDADSPSYTTRWNVKITNRVGQSVSFSY